jgi:hypothetical protein
MASGLSRTSWRRNLDVEKVNLKSAITRVGDQGRDPGVGKTTLVDSILLILERKSSLVCRVPDGTCSKAPE